MQIDITEIILAIIALLGVIITHALIPWIKTRLSNEQLTKLKSWVKIAVEAAELIIVGEGKGSERREFVIQWLKDHGMTFDADAVDLAIESAVLSLKGGKASE